MDPIAENKLLMKASDDAFNARILDGISLRYAANLIVQMVGEDPMDSDAYRRDVGWILTAFPDLRYGNDPYKLIIGEGDWTCSVAEVTGTNTGPLVELKRFGLPTLPPTDKAIRVDVCRVARWREGQIVQLEVFADFAGAARQLGLA
jgi:ketosteroid isomerase-like protein